MNASRLSHTLSLFVPLGAIAAVAALAGCEHTDGSPPAVGTTRTTSTTLTVTDPSGNTTTRNQMSSAELALLEDSDAESEQLARAMCSRKLTCGDLGPGTKMPSFEACMKRARVAAFDHFNGLSCNAGLAVKKLDACLFAVRASTCDATLDAAHGEPTCGSAELCLPDGSAAPRAAR